MTFSTSSPAFFAKWMPFGKSLNQAGDAELVHHFRELARTGRSHQAHHLRERRDDRFGLLERVGIAADHHGQLPVLGSGLSARIPAHPGSATALRLRRS